MNYKYIISNNTNIYWNFSLEEYMLDKVNDEEFIIYLWRNTPSVLIGRNQNIYSECKLEAIDKDNINLVRRKSGGGAVYFDLGNVTYSFISTRKNFDIEKNFNFIIEVLKNLGFDAVKSGRNDILYNDKKISGNAFYYYKNKCLHHGTLLLNVNLSNMSKYLSVSQRKFESKAINSVKARVTNLQEYDSNLSYENIAEAFYSLLCKKHGESQVQKENLEHIKNTAKISELQKYYDKHTSKNWIYGTNPTFNHSFGSRFTWGEIDFSFMVKENKIREIAINTDSLYPDLFDYLKEKLKNIEYDKNLIINIINDDSIQYLDFFNKELEVIFNIIKDDIIYLINNNM